MELHDVNETNRAIIGFSYSNLPDKIKRLNRKNLCKAIYGDDYYECKGGDKEISKEGIKFLQDWYWLMRDIHEGLAFNYAKFNMHTWLDFNSDANKKIQEDKTDEHFCGTVACAFGYAQVANIVPNRKMSFVVSKENPDKSILLIKDNKGRIIDSNINYSSSDTENSLNLRSSDDQDILPESLFDFIVNPGEYYDNSRINRFMKKHYNKRFKKLLVSLHADKSQDIWFGSIIPIEPENVAERIKTILIFDGRNTGEPDPNRHWLNKHIAIQPEVLGNKKFRDIENNL